MKRKKAKETTQLFKTESVEDEHVVDAQRSTFVYRIELHRVEIVKEMEGVHRRGSKNDAVRHVKGKEARTHRAQCLSVFIWSDSVTPKCPHSCLQG